jgi:hypothetical protein
MPTITKPISISGAPANTPLFITVTDTAGAGLLARTSIGTTDAYGRLNASVAGWDLAWRGFATIDGTGYLRSIAFDPESYDWTDTERAQIRYRLGLDGDAIEPTSPASDPVIILPPDDPAQCAIYIVTRDTSGEAVGGKTIHYRLRSGPGDTGASYPRTILSAVSDSNGLWQATVPRASVFDFWRDSVAGAPVRVEIDAAATMELPEILGAFT